MHKLIFSDTDKHKCWSRILIVLKCSVISDPQRKFKQIHSGNQVVLNALEILHTMMLNGIPF